MYLSFDIGGSSIKYGVVTDEGEIIENLSFSTIDNEEIIKKSILDIIRTNKKKYEIKGIGISAPGIIKKSGLMITAGAIFSLYGANLKTYIEERTDLPVTIDNDGNAAAIAEKWLGNATDLKNYICLVLGTGVGGGIVINDQVYTGAHGMAGEFGWPIIKEVPKEGNIEEVSINRKGAVINGLCTNYNNIKIKREKNYVPIFNAEDIFEKERYGDNTAHLVLESFFIDLAVSILNVISCFDPEAVLIAGGISNSEEFQKRLDKTFKQLKIRHESLNRISPFIDIPVIMAKLKNNAGILGATYQIKQRCKNV